MSTPLKDFRGKVTAETDVVLESHQRVTGRDKSEIAREVLHQWALQQLQVAKVALALADVEGIAGESKGTSGRARP